jgi:hypothetical protein
MSEEFHNYKLKPTFANKLGPDTLVIIVSLN